MEAATNDAPAFPWGEHGTHLGGLTKRELFAAMAMQGILANPEVTRMHRTDDGTHCTSLPDEAAVEYADGLLAALAKAAS